MTQEPATILDRQPLPVADDDLGSLPGYLGTRRVDRAAPPEVRAETASPAQGLAVPRPRIVPQMK